MNTKEARKIVYDFEALSRPTDEQVFAFTEAMHFLIEKENNPRDMMHLGGYYYEIKNFDLALKYYDMAAALDYDGADDCLGYIWYYGRTGVKDYEKAFKHFSRSAERGNLQSAYKVADMYKNGYFVEKDYAKYCEIIEKLYLKIKHANQLWEPLPEIFTRLAKIRTEQGKTKAAINLYLKAKDFLAQRISYNAFFGNLNIMNWLINDLYELKTLEITDDFDFFDLYYLLKNGNYTISFYYGTDKYLIECLQDKETGEWYIKFGEKCYRTVEDFMADAHIDDERLVSINTELYDFKVESIEIGSNFII